MKINPGRIMFDNFSVQVLSESSSPLEMYGVEIVPDQLNVLVVLQFGGYDSFGYAMSVKGLVKKVEYDCGNPFFLVLRSNSYQVENTLLAIFSCQ